jgi:hypothetical protein
MKQTDIYIARVPRDLKAMCINRMLARYRKHKTDFNLTVTKEYQGWMSDPHFTELLQGKG